MSALTERLKDLKKTETRVYNVVGVSFDNRQEILQDFFDRFYRVGGKHEVILVKETKNKFDSNAIAVMLNINKEYKNIGYISKNENMDLNNNFFRIIRSEIQSMGANYKGVLGLTINVILGE